jgi:eukaryotic-like serine/threonine-protein kinase
MSLGGLRGSVSFGKFKSAKGDVTFVSRRGGMLTVPLTPNIGKYRLVAELGSGGMANVYLAVMLARNGFSKLVVLKVPRAHVSEDAELLAMFLDEARLAARLNHPNVVQTYEVAEDSGRDVIVMEYLEGQTLSEILAHGRKTNRPLPLGLHIRIVLDALQGLHYAHEATDYGGEPLLLVHRDVSPQNIFVTFGGQVKVLDFGIAKAATSSHVTQAGTIKGKVRYMPPEQFAGSDIDRRADIFAIGVVLWEAATGQKLWKGTPDSDVISNILRGNIPAPRDRQPDVDERLDAIIRKALAFDREGRYASCLELQEDLESYMESTTMRSTTKDLGAFVAELFADRRRERHRVIDEQVRRATAESSGEYRVLGAGELLGSGPLSQSTITPLASSLAPFGGSGSPTNDAAGSVSTKLGLPPGGRRIVLFGGLGVVTALLVAFVVFRALSSGDETRNRESPATSLSAAASPPPSAQPVVTEVNISFAARPREAVIFLDDEPLASNPARRSVPRDGSQHTVRVEAKGHATRTVTVLYDGEKELVVALDRAVVATPAVGPQRPTTPTHVPSPPPPAPPPATTVAPPATPPSPNVTPVDPRPKRPDVRIDEKL